VGCYQGHVEGLQQDNNRLTGTLPASLSSLQFLTSVYLQGNSLQGPVPTFLATLTQLTALDLSTNVRGAWWGLLRGCGRVSLAP
jgi:hypothetical protein